MIFLVSITVIVICHHTLSTIATPDTPDTPDTAPSSTALPLPTTHCYYYLLLVALLEMIITEPATLRVGLVSCVHRAEQPLLERMIQQCTCIFTFFIHYFYSSFIINCSFFLCLILYCDSLCPIFFDCTKGSVGPSRGTRPHRVARGKGRTARSTRSRASPRVRTNEKNRARARERARERRVGGSRGGNDQEKVARGHRQGRGQKPGSEPREGREETEG